MQSVILAEAKIPCNFNLRVIKKGDIPGRAIVLASFLPIMGLNKQKQSFADVLQNKCS